LAEGADFRHDEVSVVSEAASPTTTGCNRIRFRSSPGQKAKIRPAIELVE